MPVQTPIEKTIPGLYKRNALYLLMYGYVKGCRACLHTVTIKEAIEMFMTDFGLTVDDFNIDSAMNTYFRMEKDLIKSKSSNNVS